MAPKQGYEQYLWYSDAVDGGLQSAGAVVGGGAAKESEAREIRAVGDWKPNQIREGAIRTSGSANVMLQALGIFGLAARDANGDLTSFDIEEGVDDTGTKHHRCKIDSFNLSADAGGNLNANFSWKGTHFSTVGGGRAQTVSANDSLMWYEGAIAGFPHTIEVVGFDVSVSNNCDWVYVIQDDLVPRRRAKYIREGDQNITLNLRLLEEEGTDISAPTLTEVAAVTFTFTGAGTGNVVTLTLTQLLQGTQSNPLVVGGMVVYSVSYVVTNYTLA